MLNLLLLDWAGNVLQTLVSTKITWGSGGSLLIRETDGPPVPRGSEPDDGIIWGGPRNPCVSKQAPLCPASLMQTLFGYSFSKE